MANNQTRLSTIRNVPYEVTVTPLDGADMVSTICGGYEDTLIAIYIFSWDC